MITVCKNDSGPDTNADVCVHTLSSSQRQTICKRHTSYTDAPKVLIRTAHGVRTQKTTAVAHATSHMHVYVASLIVYLPAAACSAQPSKPPRGKAFQSVQQTQLPHVCIPTTTIRHCTKAPRGTQCRCKKYKHTATAARCWGLGCSEGAGHQLYGTAVQDGHHMRALSPTI